MSPMTSSGGSLSLYFESLSAVPNVTFTVTINQVSGETIVQTARRLQDAINTAMAAINVTAIDPQTSQSYTINGIAYSGVARFSNEFPLPTFRITRTDNIIAVWSQAMFSVTVSSNTSGALVNIGPSPTLLDLVQAKNLALIMGGDFNDATDTVLPDNIICMLLETASDRVCKLVNNNFVYSGYLHELIGNLTGSTFLKMRPVIDYDPPQLRRPTILNLTSMLIARSAISYDVDRQSGIVNYRFTNALVNVAEVFDRNNEIKMSYTAGYMRIPTIVQEKTLQLAFETMQSADGSIQELKGGSLGVKYFRPLETLQWLATELRDYRIGF